MNHYRAETQITRPHPGSQLRQSRGPIHASDGRRQADAALPDRRRRLAPHPEVADRRSPAPGSFRPDALRHGLRNSRQIRCGGVLRPRPVRELCRPQEYLFYGSPPQGVADQYHTGYVSPQESGTHSDLCWWKQPDATGFGLEIRAANHFSASAIPYSIAQLNNGTHQYVRHPSELVSDGRTHVCVDGAQSGLGCINSKGRLPLQQYLLPYGDYDFEFSLNIIQ